MSQPFLLTVKNLTKKYDQFSAVTNVNFQIKPNQIVALIGPNGSGKTTLIKCIVGLHFPDKGQIILGDHNIQTQPLAAKKLIGYVPDNPIGFDYLTGQEFLNLTIQLKQANKLDKYLSRLMNDFNLTPLLNKRISNYSRGNRQKLAFVASLIGQPKLLIIDEPIVGLDPDSIEVFGSALKKFAQGQGAVLFSTHILEFGKRFATQLVVLNQGRIKLNTKVTNKTSLTKQYQKLTK